MSSSTAGHGPDSTPDVRPDVRRARGGHPDVIPVVGENQDCGPLPTRADTVRPDTDSRPTDSRTGVRFEYRASVPRHLVGAAFAEAFALLGDELEADGQAPDDPLAPPPPPTCD
ncbi:hypothetical protein OV450_1431 [Actinobacteria bacterium OV450]|nr:hypothetical protein OV450_1431 [Actinobacteria bacterium OV450]